jgi:Na+/H+-dicarboxylate symporter
MSALRRIDATALRSLGMPHKHALPILILIVIGVVAGVFCGWYWGEAALRVAWLGDLFLNALKMMIIPLIVAAVTSGVAALGDVRKLGRLGGVTVVYYLCTTCVAVAVGLLMVNLIRPGAGLAFEAEALPEHLAGGSAFGASDLLLMLVKPNIVAAAAQGQLLPLIVFAILFAAALSTLGPRGRPVIDVLAGINEAMMKIVVWIIYLAPVGIFALVAARLGAAGGGEALWREISAVGWHIVTVLTGLAVHFAILLLVARFLAGRGLDYLWQMLRALLTAFGTASSSATLPLTMQCAEESGVDARALRFVLPLGSTVNMDGTALYEAAAALFIAQAYGIELGFGQQMLIFVTATLAAIGAAGIPEAGLVTLVIVLSAVGLPQEGVALLLAVDWLLDRFRTAVNVWGDAVGAAVVDRFLTDSRVGAG